MGFLRAQRDRAEKYRIRSNCISCFLRDEPLEDGLNAHQLALPWATTKNGKGRGYSMLLTWQATSITGRRCFSKKLFYWQEMMAYILPCTAMWTRNRRWTCP